MVCATTIIIHLHATALMLACPRLFHVCPRLFHAFGQVITLKNSASGHVAVFKTFLNFEIEFEIQHMVRTMIGEDSDLGAFESNMQF